MDSLELAIAAAIARDSLPERECTKCGEMKGPGAFRRNAKGRDGLDTWCKTCATAYNVRWRAENAEKVREYHVRYRAERKNDPEYREKERERDARRRAERKNDPEYREKARKRAARYRAERKNDPEYREKERERDARRRAERKNDPEYREKARKRAARYYAENKDKVRERNARWRAENPDKVRAKKRKRRALKRRVYHAPYTEADILAGNGGMCRYCDTEKATTLDHFIPIAWGGDDAPWNLIGACASCNSSKADRDPYEWMASRGIDLDAWEARHIAGWFELPAELWESVRSYRPPAEEV